VKCCSVYRSPIDWLIFNLGTFNCNLRKHDDAELHFDQVTES